MGQSYGAASAEPPNLNLGADGQRIMHGTDHGLLSMETKIPRVLVRDKTDGMYHWTNNKLAYQEVEWCAYRVS